MSVLRGRPPGLAGGINGSSSRNWSSVRAWPAPKFPTSARSAGVHMAVSRQETARNAARGARISPSDRCPHPFANGVLEPGQPGAEQAEVMACGGEDEVGGIALGLAQLAVLAL